MSESGTNKWLMVGAVAGLAVLVGAAFSMRGPSSDGAGADGAAAASDAGQGEATPAPAAAAEEPTESDSGERWGKSALCDELRASTKPPVTPRVAYEGAKGDGAPFRGQGPARRLGASLQHQPRLGQVVQLVSEDRAGREAVVETLQRAVCDLRPVFNAAQAAELATDGKSLPQTALVVAELEAGDPQLSALLTLTENSRSPGMLLVSSAPNKLPTRVKASTVTLLPLDCQEARKGLSAALSARGEGMAQRVEAWGLLEANAEGDCAPPAALRSLGGVLVVAEALAAHPAPPSQHNGTWSSWVALAAGGGEAAEAAALDGRARALAGKLTPPAAGDARRSACARWADDHLADLKEPELVAHLVGQRSARDCVAAVASVALGAGVRADTLMEAIDRGLGTGPWRGEALAVFAEDVGDGSGDRALQAVLEGLQR